MIRPYASKDKPALLALLRCHIPQYFAPSEEQDFAKYLDEEVEAYYVFEEKGQVIAGGGINYFPDKAEARISWDFVHPDFQGNGVGSQLTEYRLEAIRLRPVRRVVVRTSQLAYQYYEKFGFECMRVEKDFWAPGYDLYEMKMELNPEASESNTG